MGFCELIDKYGKGASDTKMKELTMVLEGEVQIPYEGGLWSAEQSSL